MLSEEFLVLRPRDRLIYLTIVLRAPRYFVLTNKINGMKVRMQPGQYYRSLARLSKECPSYTSKQVRTSLERLVEADFIQQRDLHQKRGRIITLIGWGDSGQSKRQSDFGKMGKEKFPFPPSIIPPSTVQNGQSDFREMGKGFGQHKESYSGERKVLKGETVSRDVVEKEFNKNGVGKEIQHILTSSLKPTRCGDCRYFIPYPQSPAKQPGRCTLDAPFTSTDPPNPSAYRKCLQFEAKAQAPLGRSSIGAGEIPGVA